MKQVYIYFHKTYFYVRDIIILVLISKEYVLFSFCHDKSHFSLILITNHNFLISQKVKSYTFFKFFKKRNPQHVFTFQFNSINSKTYKISLSENTTSVTRMVASKTAVETGVVRAKNARQKRKLMNEAPKVFENAKSTIFIKGGNVSDVITSVFTDLHRLKV